MDRDVTDTSPTIVVSECLGFAAVRYNGRMLSSGFVDRLRRHVRFVPICPEVGIGLGVPRNPIRIIAAPDGDRLVQLSTSRDLTGRMVSWASGFLESTGSVDGFILKSRSPSCGVGDVVRFRAGSEAPLDQGADGMFARAVLDAHPQIAVDDELSLRRPEARHHFLTRVFTAARLRRVREGSSGPGLERFHREHAALLAMYDHGGAEELRHIAGSAGDDRDPREAVDAYGISMARMMARPVRTGALLRAAIDLLPALEAPIRAGDGALRRMAGGGEHRSGEEVTPMRLLSVLREVVDAASITDPAVRRFLEPYPRELLDAEEPETDE